MGCGNPVSVYTRFQSQTKMSDKNPLRAPHTTALVITADSLEDRGEVVDALVANAHYLAGYAVPAWIPAVDASSYAPHGSAQHGAELKTYWAAVAYAHPDVDRALGDWLVRISDGHQMRAAQHMSPRLYAYWQMQPPPCRPTDAVGNRVENATAWADEARCRLASVLFTRTATRMRTRRLADMLQKAPLPPLCRAHDEPFAASGPRAGPHDAHYGAFDDWVRNPVAVSTDDARTMATLYDALVHPHTVLPRTVCKSMMLRPLPSAVEDQRAAGMRATLLFYVQHNDRNLAALATDYALRLNRLLFEAIRHNLDVDRAYTDAKLRMLDTESLVQYAAAYDEGLMRELDRCFFEPLSNLFEDTSTGKTRALAARKLPPTSPRLSETDARQPRDGEIVCVRRDERPRSATTLILPPLLQDDVFGGDRVNPQHAFVASPHTRQHAAFHRPAKRGAAPTIALVEQRLAAMATPHAGADGNNVVVVAAPLSAVDERLAAAWPCATSDALAADLVRQIVVLVWDDETDEARGATDTGPAGSTRWSTHVVWLRGREPPLVESYEPVRGNDTTTLSSFLRIMHLDGDSESRALRDAAVTLEAGTASPFSEDGGGDTLLHIPRARMRRIAERIMQALPMRAASNWQSDGGCWQVVGTWRLDRERAVLPPRNAGAGAPGLALTYALWYAGMRLTPGVPLLATARWTTSALWGARFAAEWIEANFYHRMWAINE